MHSSFVPITTALEALEAAVTKLSNEKRSLLEVHGWNFPAIDAEDLGNLVSDFRDWVIDNAPDEETALNVAEIVKRITLLQSTTAQYLFNGNGNVAVPNFMMSLDGIKGWLKANWPAREIVRPDSLPSKLARQSRTAKARLDSIQNEIEGVSEKLQVISDAHAAAEALPTDLEELKQLRASMLAASGQSTADQQAIGQARAAAIFELQGIQEAHKIAADLVAKCEDAYQITTTKGLSAAFAQRAFRLGVTVWVWVAGLLGALGTVAFLGHDRIAALTDLISDDPKWGVVVMNLLLSALSVGAPLWFAWVATKQIGQRFRLAEDYGFKASVAKAYEGYRREAHRIDPAFEAQLFSIALTRLEEAPLRMVETEAHGSPYHELLTKAQVNPDFKAALGRFLDGWRRPPTNAPAAAAAASDGQTS